MFGFLRRKKSDESGDAPTAAAPAPAQDATDGAAPGGEPAGTPAQEPPTPKAGGFWSRFVPGGSGTPARDGSPPASAAEDAAGTPSARADRDPAPDPAPDTAPAAATDRAPWLARLKQGLSRTRGNLAGLFIGVKVDEALFEELETALIGSDAGVETTAWLLSALRERVRKDRITDPMQVKAALRTLLVELLAPLEQPIDIDRAEPLVMMIAGVNGAGKTTSIGKLARHLRREGKTVLLAAGDTFRAAAREQLAQWGSRNEVERVTGYHPPV